ncbi:MAG: hypothetical protein GQ574_24775 [Crocinitomix sp.]|nr:hypothetical protein [Crocinitomix sp.]
MTEKNILDQHTAGPQSVGYDYQFYYFMFLSLTLTQGQKIGFEVKDDIHIDRQDGITLLFQAKHTIQKDSKGNIQNLTTSDIDLWKTLNNWSAFIKSDKNFLDTHEFILVTNKNVNNNSFIDALEIFIVDNDIDKILATLNEIKKDTSDSSLKSYLKSVISLGKRKLRTFLEKLKLETDTNSIEIKIKNKIHEIVRQDNLVEPVFEKLSANLLLAKYTDIKTRNKFEISYDDFNSKFGKCFEVAFQEKPLPKRNLPVTLPEDPEDQIFIKQLIDVGEIEQGSKDIITYTTQMLKFLNDFSFWSDENFLLPTEIGEFNKNSVTVWHNEFKSKYRTITNKIRGGSTLANLEDEIKILATSLIDELRKQNLSIEGFYSLGISHSNGHFYALSDKLDIGWHFDWKNKYGKA